MLTSQEKRLVLNVLRALIVFALLTWLLQFFANDLVLDSFEENYILLLVVLLIFIVTPFPTHPFFLFLLFAFLSGSVVWLFAEYPFIQWNEYIHTFHRYGYALLIVHIVLLCGILLKLQTNKKEVLCIKIFYHLGFSTFGVVLLALVCYNFAQITHSNYWISSNTLLAFGSLFIFLSIFFFGKTRSSLFYASSFSGIRGGIHLFSWLTILGITSQLLHFSLDWLTAGTSVAVTVTLACKSFRQGKRRIEKVTGIFFFATGICFVCLSFFWLKHGVRNWNILEQILLGILSFFFFLTMLTSAHTLFSSSLKKWGFIVGFTFAFVMISGWNDKSSLYQRQWSLSFSHQIASVLKVTKQSIYIRTIEDILYSINRKTGKINWKRKESLPLLGKLFRVKKQLIYRTNQTVSAIDSITGNTIWSLPAPRKLLTLFLKGQLLYLQFEKKILALNYLTGKQKWSHSTRQKSSFFVFEQVYVLTSKQLYLVSRQQNKQKWSIQLSGRLVSLKEKDSVLYTLTTKQKEKSSLSLLSAYSSLNGKRLWTFQAKGQNPLLTFGNRRLYLQSKEKLFKFSHKNKNLYCLQYKTGVLQKRITLRNGHFYFSKKKQLIFFGEDEKKVYAWMDDTLNLKWSYDKEKKSYYPISLIPKLMLLHMIIPSTLSAISLQTGKQLWERQINRMILIGASKQEIYLRGEWDIQAISLTNGSLRWRKRIRTKTTQGVFYKNNTLYIIGSKNRINAIEPTFRSRF